MAELSSRPRSVFVGVFAPVPFPVKGFLQKGDSTSDFGDLFKGVEADPMLALRFSRGPALRSREEERWD